MMMGGAAVVRPLTGLTAPQARPHSQCVGEQLRAEGFIPFNVYPYMSHERERYNLLRQR